MKNKSERLLQIRKLIGAEKIASQEEMLSLLKASGFNMTQATLSRDLKYLKVAKMPDAESGYIYMLTERALSQPSENLISPATGVVSIDFATILGICWYWPYMNNTDRKGSRSRHVI